MLSTIHRRNILSYFEITQTSSFKKLKGHFIDTGTMNQTTLYRILEKFVSEGILHHAEFDNEKYYTLCQCGQTNQEAVALKCCTRCHTIEEKHSPLSPESLKSETIELTKYCTSCTPII